MTENIVTRAWVFFIVALFSGLILNIDSSQANVIYQGDEVKQGTASSSGYSKGKNYASASITLKYTIPERISISQPSKNILASSFYKPAPAKEQKIIKFTNEESNQSEYLVLASLYSNIAPTIDYSIKSNNSSNFISFTNGNQTIKTKFSVRNIKSQKGNFEYFIFNYDLNNISGLKEISKQDFVAPITLQVIAP